MNADGHGETLRGSKEHTLSSPVGTLERGLALLAALGNRGGGMTLTELASSAGLPKPTTARLLNTLTAHGFVERHGGSYLAGYQCLRLGNLYTFDESLQRRALPVMKGLMNEVREVVQLGTLREENVLYLERVEPRRSIAVVPSRPGSTRPAYCTALGKAMLSRLESEELDAYLAQAELEAKTSTTITTRQALFEEMNITRERGYAVDDGEGDEEIGCVAAPILDHSGHPSAAMSVSAPRFRMVGEDRERAGQLVRRAATELCEA